MRTGAIIQARTGSTRLPSKVLLRILDKSILEYVVERVRHSKHIDTVIVATTDNNEDLEIAELMKGISVSVFRGSENDVLDRYYKAASFFNIQNIVRITADCPLIDPFVIDCVIKRYFSVRADYCSNILEHTFPDGEDVEVFSFKTLSTAWKEAKLGSEREHVTPYIINNPGSFKLENVKSEVGLSDKRWTLDRKEDYDFIKKVIENLYPTNPNFRMSDVLKFVRDNPECEDINKNIIRNEGYLKSLQKDILNEKKS
ncbi:MAG: glycosyltransferase family protein [Candidatus Omnitrophica bacterium]|nr:glycosyltransferase family protein [Candidatus Omnitrophota bacterium]